MRFERKYRIEHLDWQDVVEVIRRHPLSFRTLHPDRQINNIYLDTADLSGMRENLIGISERQKYRIRWYGKDLFHVQKPILEIKLKHGGMGDKVLIPLPDFEWRTVQELRAQVNQILDAQRSRVKAHAGEAGGAPMVFPSANLIPSLVNTYVRSYFVSYDQKFRLTIDRELRFYSPEMTIFPNLNYAQDHAVIVEVKYAEEDDARYESVGHRMPFRLSRNSKYVIGMLLTGNR